MSANTVDGTGKRANVVIALSITLVLCLSFIISNQGQSSTGPSEEPRIPYEGDFVASYDEPENGNNALHPAVAVSPMTAGEFAGFTHIVWDEFDEVSGYREIHFSMSDPRSLGHEWSNDEPTEGDRMVSDSRKGKVTNYGDAVNPSIAIDSGGNIHVVWAERYDESGYYTWEIHYTRSTDNGRTWTGADGLGDILVSHRSGGREDAQAIPGGPSIAVSYNIGKAAEVIHVVWAEYSEKYGQEIYYSSSWNGGNSWTGQEVDRIISKTGSSEYAYDPCVVTSGPAGELVHAFWKQLFVGKAPLGDEIFYTFSTNYGQNWTGLEEAISDPWIHGTIGSLSATGGLNDLHVVWNQTISGKAEPWGIFYSSSFENGMDRWAFKELQIDSNDGQQPGVPTVAVTRDIGKAPMMEVWATWSEVDEKSPAGTFEIHSSMTNDPSNPESWTGHRGDNVMSWPDDYPYANVANASVSMGWFEGRWTPKIVWDELNYYKGMSRAQHNNEIHTLPQYTLTIIVVGSGTVSADPSSLMYTSGTRVVLTANPSVGWYFDYWGGDLSGSSNPDDIVMDSDKTVYAYFTQYQYTLTITISPGGSGTVTKNPNQATYTYGQVVTLTANPNTGYHFDHWSGALSGSANPTTITMYGNRAVTAYFVLNQYTLTTSVTGSGSIAKSPDQATYPYNTVVTVTANPAWGWEFTTWGGDLSGSTNPDVVTMTSNKSISATFVQISFTTALAPGWHLLSVPLIQSNTSLQSVLSTISGNYDIVQVYNASDTSDYWKTYSTFKPSCLNDLSNINHTIGFWLHTTSPCNLTFYGPRPTSTNITLRAGWNLVGYPARNDSTYNVTQLKASTGATKVEGIDLTSPYRTKELLGTEILKRGRGYWVLVPSDTVWTVFW